MTIKALYPSIDPTLDLDFAGSKRLDPRITYTRASTGTYVGADGLIKNAAVNEPRFDHAPTTGESLGLLVEEARTNNVRQSIVRPDLPGDTYSFWTLSSGATITPNADIAPDGTFTAALVNIGAGAANRNIIARYEIALANVSNLCESIWLKSITGTARIGLVGSPTGADTITYFSIGTQWTRINVLKPTKANYFLTLYAENTTSLSFYAWGGQTETGSFPTSNIATIPTFTGRASTATFYDSAGVLQTAASGVARSAAFLPDATGVMRSAGLLLEAARTNLLNGSQTFATAGGTQNNWVDTNITRDGTLRTSPDGTANALRVTAAAADATIISSAAIGTSAGRTFSIFLRRVTGTGNIQYTLDNGTTWTTQAITSSWVRYSFPATTADQQVGIRIATSGDAIELWGAQLEASPYATSYIPTTTATVTRAADTSTSATVTRSADVAQITGTNFSSWYRQDEGAIFAHIQRGGGNASKVFALANTAAPATNRIDTRSGTSIINANSSTNLDLGGGFSPSASASNKVAVAYKAGSYAKALNNAIAGTSSQGSLPVGINRLIIGGIDNFDYSEMSARISRLTYWPQRLPDATLQAITIR